MGLRHRTRHFYGVAYFFSLGGHFLAGISVIDFFILLTPNGQYNIYWLLCIWIIIVLLVSLNLITSSSILV